MSMRALTSAPKNTRVFIIPIRFVVALLTGVDGEVRTLKLLSDGIPEDGKVVGHHIDWDRDEIYIKVEHPSFPLCPEGCVYERIAVYFERGPEDHLLELL